MANPIPGLSYNTVDVTVIETGQTKQELWSNLTVSELLKFSAQDIVSQNEVAYWVPLNQMYAEFIKREANWIPNDIRYSQETIAAGAWGGLTTFEQIFNNPGSTNISSLTNMLEQSKTAEREIIAPHSIGFWVSGVVNADIRAAFRSGVFTFGIGSIKDIYTGRIGEHASGSGIAQDANIGVPRLAVRLRFVDSYGNPYVLRIPQNQKFQFQWSFGTETFTAATDAVVTLMGPRGDQVKSVSEVE